MSNTLITKKGRNQKHDIIEEIHEYNIMLDTREIFLYGESDSEACDSGIDFRMANKFLKNLRLLESSGDNPIIIHQYSTGGEWHSGMSIYDMIHSSSCHIIFIMHGTACSMGSIVPQAADTKIIMPNCIFMVHDGYTGINSDLTHKQSLSWNAMEVQTREVMLDIYCGVCVNGHLFQKEQADQKKIRKFIIDKLDQKEDWWLFARDAVRYGFADAVLGDDGYENIESIKESIING